VQLQDFALQLIDSLLIAYEVFIAYYLKFDVESKRLAVYTVLCSKELTLQYEVICIGDLEIIYAWSQQISYEF